MLLLLSENVENNQNYAKKFKIFYISNLSELIRGQNQKNLKLSKVESISTYLPGGTLGTGVY